MTCAVTLIPGDGTGPALVEAARRVLDATRVGFEWDLQEAGAAVFEREGSALPPRVIESVRRHGLALKGPITTPAGATARSANIALRRELDLYAGVRPCKTYEGLPRAFPGIDLVVVRMNHEDLYAGIEYERGGASTSQLREFIESTEGTHLDEDVGISIKPLSESGAARVVRAAFRHARDNGRSKVTAVHKATVMKHTDGVFLDAARQVAEQEFPEIEFDDRLLDTVCYELVSRRRDYDVLVLPTLYGDVVSDICAALIGSIGLAPGANVGDGCAVFEAVHGSAPKHAGADRANPMALMLSGVMLLRHIGESHEADRVERAIAAVIREGVSISYDLTSAQGPGTATTSEVTDAVVAKLKTL